MAGDVPSAAGADSAVEAVKKEWRLQEEMQKRDLYRKSKYPPMTIEPFPRERQRVPFKMTDEDRAWRAQWLHDQALSPNEPRFVPELRPRNSIRRALAAPWDFAFKFLTPRLAPEKAAFYRWFWPRVGLGVVALYGAFYYLKYNRATWETQQGWHFYSSKPRTFPGQTGSEASEGKNGSQFFDKGFSQRKVMRDI